MSSAHVQELRGHYVRRLPTPEEISTRSPIVLTERDVQVLVAVHQHGFLTTDLVELAFFPPSSGSRSSASSKAYERVRDLWLWGYLERVELPVARVLGGRRPFLYSLGLQGVPFVETRIGTAVLPVQPRRLDRLDHVFVDHDLKAAALWANLRAQLRGRRGCRWLWIGERELRARRMRVRAPRAGYWLPFLPDGYFEVTYPNGEVQACLVEIDMGTLTLRRFTRKVQAFETALEDEVFRRHFKRDEFEVLVLSQSRRRLEALRQAAGRVVPNERHGDYYLSTFADVLTPSAFSTATWWNLDRQSCAGVFYAE
jgi:protein involved in plasmid replication-relaxation